MTTIKFDPSHRNSLFDLYQHFNHKYYCDNTAEERWRWRRRPGVFPWWDGLGFPLLILQGAHVVGTLDGIPNLLYLNGQYYTSVTDTDFYVHENGRPGGLNLILSLLQNVDIYTCGNGPPEVMEIYCRLGFQRVGHGQQTWQKRLLSRSMAAFKILNLFSRKSYRNAIEFKSGLRWCISNDFTAVEEIQARFRQDCIKGIRSKDFMEWRVSERPGPKFDLWLCSDQNGQRIGYSIIRKIKRKSIMPYQAIIYDFGYCQDIVTMFDQLFIESVDQLLVATGCDVSTWFVIGDWGNQLGKAGYHLIGSEPFVASSRIKGEILDTDWHLTLIDTEKFLYL